MAGELVFVYGTLRRGASNAFRMEGGEFVRRGQVRGKLYRIDWYPGLVLDEEHDWVTGEVWRVTPEQLTRLDDFEGLPAGSLDGKEYRRVKVMVVASADFFQDDAKHFEPLEVWAWEWKGGGEKRISSGDWLDVDRSRAFPVQTFLGCVVPVSLPIGAIVLLGFWGRLTGWYVPVAWVIAAVLVTVLLAMVATFYLANMGDRSNERGRVWRQLARVAGAFLLLAALFLVLLLVGVLF